MGIGRADPSAEGSGVWTIEFLGSLLALTTTPCISVAMLIKLWAEASS